MWLGATVDTPTTVGIGCVLCEAASPAYCGECFVSEVAAWRDSLRRRDDRTDPPAESSSGRRGSARSRLATRAGAAATGDRTEGEGGQLVGFPQERAWEAWITVDQLRRHYAVSPRTVERWRERGCPSRKLASGGRRYRLADVDAWLRSQESNA